MNKGKSVFVTVLVAAMLVLIDIGLYLISETGFVVLTGALAVYGYFRGAGDFWHWLAKETPIAAPVIEPISVPRTSKRDAYDWQHDDPITAKHVRQEAPDFYDVLIVDEAKDYQS